MMTVISSKGQIVLPAELRKQDHIRTGEQFEVERLDCGQYLLTKLELHAEGGVLDWLRACPDKGWFRSLSSESTDDI
jgi:AbrB family looped-hinge helix DNA binding protein